MRRLLEWLFPSVIYAIRVEAWKAGYKDGVNGVWWESMARRQYPTDVPMFQMSEPEVN